MLGSFLSFRTRHQPYMVRLSYRYEMRSALTYPLAASLAEGSFTGVVAAKYFNGSTLMCVVSLAGFISMARHAPRKRAVATAAAEEAEIAPSAPR